MNHLCGHISTHPLENVHGDEDRASGAVVGNGTEEGDNPFCLPKMTRCVISIELLHSFNKYIGTINI